MKTTLNKLSGIEQKVYFSFEEKDQRVITLKEVSTLLGVSKQYASKILHLLTKKNACEKIKSGLYVRFPASIVINKGSYREDPLLLAGHLSKNYFFSFYTALSLHGLSQRVTNVFYVSNLGESGEIKYHNYKIKMVKLISTRFFGFLSRDYSGQKIFVSDLERTFLDIIDRPEFGGGWREIIESLGEARDLNWDKVIEYLDRFERKSLAQRTGYILDILKESLKVPSSIIRKLEKRVSSNIYYFKKGVGRYNKKWNVIVPSDIIKVY